MQNNTAILIKNATVYLEDNKLSQGNIYLENGKIKSIGKGEIPFDKASHVIDATGLNAIPGFIDGHIHGANGADTMDATAEALEKIASTLPMEGTTSFLATTITQSTANITRALENAACYQNKPGHAEMVGIHLEGPFVEKTKAGAQPKQYIIQPDLERFLEWQKQANGKIKTITIAPEHDEDGRFIRSLAKSGVNVSAGHTNAGFAGIKKAVSQGVSQLTHLCNAMNGIHHRDIGAVGAAFQLESLRAELIADGIHVSPEMLQLIYNNIGSERIILITDAMRAKGLPDGKYELGGQPVKVENEMAVLADGTLAGSILKMDEAAKQMLKLEGVTLKSIVEMASVNPAKQIGIYNEKGSISPGKDADILLVDDALNIRYTICRGHVSFQ
ncbi:N-acetylglucosamine-6-phosphate deacetylase [Oceanobacillus sp. FSL H7-0719]|uniref:N-acetylglucosamine-6-phosphate deacetylase n=1 Tax=Oceanobacillus sp. FSL H7-0719 TaxID=2954507 RepID=UPI003251E987